MKTKGIVSIVLCFALMLSISAITAFADSSSNINENNSYTPMHSYLTSTDDFYLHLGSSTRIVYNNSNCYVGYGCINLVENVISCELALNYEDAKESGLSCNVGNPDSSFDYTTYQAIVAFQTFCNSMMPVQETVDGIVGPVTWRRFVYMIG